MAGSSAAKRELVLVGAGRMGSALLEGWIKAGLVGSSAPVAVIEPQPPESLRKRVDEGFAIRREPPLTPGPARQLVVLAVKPQTLDTVLAGLRPIANAGAAFLSIVAGRTIASLAKGLAPQGMPPPIIRAMPNTPAAIGTGITAAYAGPGVDSVLTAQANALLAAVGEVVWLQSEDLIDAATAVSGSGPAYFFHLVEALSSAGTSIGLPPETAERLARATLVGSAALLKSSGESPADLRKAVTSPGGTTEAALKVLMGEKGLPPLMRKAVEAAFARAKTLAKS